METCFSDEKLIKQFGNFPFPFQLTLIEQFFPDPPICPNFKNKNPP